MVANRKIAVSVSADGDIMADGQPATLERLSVRFAELKQAGGVVLYHRENPSGEPHPNGMKVIELVIANQLPIRLSTSPDFSDAVDDQGVSQPGGSIPHLGRDSPPRLPTARAYRHQQCGSLTEISGNDFLRLANPFSVVGQTICCTCQRAIPIRQVTWADTGENVATYRKRLRRAMPLGRRLFFSCLGSIIGAIAGFLCGYLIGFLIIGPVGNRPWWMQASGLIGGTIAAFAGLQFGAQLLPAHMMRLIWGLDYRGET
jgi:hypothetical protein